MSTPLIFTIAIPSSLPAVSDWRAQLVDTDGVDSGSAISTGFVSLGTGQGFRFYQWYYALDDDFQGSIKFYSDASSSVILGVAAVNPSLTANDINTLLETEHGSGSWVFSGTVSATYPILIGVLVETVSGDDYRNDDNRAIDFTETEGNWPTLTGATVKLKIAGTQRILKDGTVVTATGSNKKVRFELTNQDTVAIGVGTFNYEVEAKLPGEIVVTLIPSRVGRWTNTTKISG